MTNSLQAELDETAASKSKKAALAIYLRNIRDWHGYIRFLGLPDRRDNPDILIDRLFVDPQVARRRIMSGEEPQGWIESTESIYDALRNARGIVILGDPGSGKSTIVNYLVWTLTSTGSTFWKESMGGWQLPIPMVLRELDLRYLETFDDLLEAFMGHAICQPLRNTEILKETVLNHGCIVLMDGIDEVGDQDARRRLRSALHDGVIRYPKCRWILTSRIVGYDEVPFHLGNLDKVGERDARSRTASQTTHRTGSSGSVAGRRRIGTESGAEPSVSLTLHKEIASTDADLLDKLRNGPRTHDTGFHREPNIQVRYVAPFDDDRIEAFARNWYRHREASTAKAEESVRNFMDAIRQDRAIVQLGRIPNLLTMMTLIHRNEATLPHGRVLLYDRISEAYLESIDRYRGVQSGAFSLSQKRQWLARIGFEMQKRRSVEVSGQEDSSGTNLLAEKDDVEGWVTSEMDAAPHNVAGMSPTEFLDIVGRRSGLFLPRGENRYAFVHLSFQDYFAALAVEQEVTGPSWIRGRRSRLGLDRDSITALVQQVSWFETFAFLFELLADRVDWHNELLDVVFDWSTIEESARSSDGWLFDIENDSNGNEAVDKSLTVNKAKLLCRLVGNPLSGLGAEARLKAIGLVVSRAVNKREVVKEILSDVLSIGEEWVSELSYRLRMRLGGTSVREVDLSDVRVETLDWISAASTLTHLHLDGTGIENIEPLESLELLEVLDLSNTQVESIGSLRSARHLRLVFLHNTTVEDLSPLRSARRLRVLSADFTNVESIEVASHWEVLEWLTLGNTRVKDITPLTGARKLEYLSLADTSVDNVAALSELMMLSTLVLRGSKLTDLRPLSGLRNLKRLDLWDTSVDDLAPLSQLGELASLDLGYTKVRDLEPLARLGNLKALELWQTNVIDLRPLKGLTHMEKLDLDGTKVEDLSPLKGMSNLRRLDLRNIEGKDWLSKQARAMFPECRILV